MVNLFPLARIPCPHTPFAMFPLPNNSLTLTPCFPLTNNDLFLSSCPPNKYIYPLEAFINSIFTLIWSPYVIRYFR